MTNSKTFSVTVASYKIGALGGVVGVGRAQVKTMHTRAAMFPSPLLSVQNRDAFAERYYDMPHLGFVVWK